MLLMQPFKQACLSIILCALSTVLWAAPSAIIPFNADSSLRYLADTRGNRIPDFSNAGYKGGGTPIPDIDVTVTISPPASGDATASIQAAINQVGSLPLNAQGFRGAVLLKKGIYNVVGPIRIVHNGIVIRGEGAGNNGTIIRDTGTDTLWRNTFEIGGYGYVAMGKRTDITDAYVPVGARKMHVANTAGLAVGKTIFVRSQHTQKWVDSLHLTGFWNPLNNGINRWQRQITAINPATNEIEVDINITSSIDKANGYAVGEIDTITADHRVYNTGFEDFVILSGYNRALKDTFNYYNDENHAARAFAFYQARDAWVRRVNCYFYMMSFVTVWNGSSRVTIEDCASLDGVSLDNPRHHQGMRKYYYDLSGDESLTQRCYSRYARHAFITNTPNSGNVFLDSYSCKGHLWPGPHQNWESGTIFDNVWSNTALTIGGSPASSHGQMAANCVLWNCTVVNDRTFEGDIYMNKPLYDLGQNWAIGCKLSGGRGVQIYLGYGDTGYTESIGTFVQPRSLYLWQLRDRLGMSAVRSITTSKQTISSQEVYNDLLAKYNATIEWGDPYDLSWMPDAVTYDKMVGASTILSEKRSDAAPGIHALPFFITLCGNAISVNLSKGAPGITFDIQIVTSTGRVVEATNQTSSSSITWTSRNLASGNYFVQIKSNGREWIVEKCILKH